MAAGRDYPGPSAADIADLLRPHAQALAQMVFPNARLAGGRLYVGSLQGEPGDSLVVTLRGPKAGTWADYATSETDPQGKGDMLKLLQLTVGGGDFKAGLAEAKRFLNLDTMDPRALERMQMAAEKAKARAERQAQDERERKRANSEGLWQSASPLTPASPAVQYLAGRGIDFAVLGKLPGAIRFHHAVWHAETGKKLPAMVTKATLLDGRHAATHVTYLHYEAARAGSSGGWVKLPKIEVERTDKETGELVWVALDFSKKIFSPLYWGAHIPLWKGAQRCPLKGIAPGTDIEASEGIEDGLSYAMANPGARIVAGMTLGNLAQMELPPQAGDLVLLGQNDTKPEPLASREEAIRQQQARAQEQGSSRQVRLRLPPPGIKDWNDWLRMDAPAGEKSNGV